MLDACAIVFSVRKGHLFSGTKWAGVFVGMLMLGQRSPKQRH